MPLEKRQISSSERIRLERIIKEEEQYLGMPLNWKAILILSVLTFLFGIHIYYYPESSWSLPSKFLVCVCPIIIWIVIENKYKGKKKKNKILNKLKSINEGEPISVMQVTAVRMIEFKEKEDEGTLFLFETSSKECIYLWDDQWLIQPESGFPCDIFDIYLDADFSYAMECKVFCKGQKIEPIKIPGKVKWTYFEKGFPASLDKEQKSFDEIIAEIKLINSPH
jgi:hypothetical protein